MEIINLPLEKVNIYQSTLETTCPEGSCKLEVDFQGVLVQ